MSNDNPPLSSLQCAIGSPTTSLSDDVIREELDRFLTALGPSLENIMIVPPDFTRFHSQAGKITQMVTQYYDNKNNTGSSTPHIQIMPALGTHAPMTQSQIKTMFGDAAASREILVHDWRSDVVTIGHVPAEMVADATYGLVQDQPWPAQLNQQIWDMKKDKDKSLVLSIGQIVPHEVLGMANYNKNLFVGVGGVEAINLSHFIGAVHGMEKMMGRATNPLRDILNYASDRFLKDQLNVWYVLTVMGANETTGMLEMKGLYIGNDIQCYEQACELSLQVNFTLLPRPPTTIVAHLDPDEFHSTWLGNKAIYRTRMAIADGGHLIILAPGVEKFGEDAKVDALIRKYGYVGTPKIMQSMRENSELQENLSAVAHLIHGSSEGRFTVTYCPGHLTKEEVEQVGFQYADLSLMQQRYNVQRLTDGWNTDEESGEEFFYISNPALGLWAVAERFEESKPEPSCSSKSVEGSVPTSSKQDAVDGSGGVGGNMS